MDVGFSHSTVQTVSRSHNIKQKISQEGRTNDISSPDKWPPKDFAVRYKNCHQEKKKNPVAEGKSKQLDVNSQNVSLDINEDTKNSNQSENESEKREYDGTCFFKDKSESNWVCSQVNQIESWKKVVLNPETALPPGNFYTSQILWKKIEVLPPDKVLNLALEHCDASEKELNFRVLDSSYGITKSLENIYSKPEGQECGPSIYPLPKSHRTFRYLSESGVMPYKKRNCDRKYCESDSWALASSWEPEPKKYGRKIGKSKRKSFEFENIQHFRNWNTREIHEELGRNSGSALYYTQSEDNIYEDITYPTKENPYEDIPGQPLPMWRSPSVEPPPKSVFRAPKLPPKPQFLHRKTVALKNSHAYFWSKPSIDTTLPITLTKWKLFAGEVAKRKRKNLPRLVLKIDDIFESKREKKRVKLHPYTGKDVPPSKDKNCSSWNESDDEYLPKNRHKHLAQLQQSSKRDPNYQTLERDLVELQERQLFDLFVIVFLQKKPSEISYILQVKQFPSKGDHGFKQSKNTEERLKVIPKFCFPDSEDWVPTSKLKSKTFSFVLTGEDGNWWYGYCKKLLPEGKGKLPEIYCPWLVAGCFNLFSKILDEVEKRDVSALVYPFMRSIMEAPFPAPGHTITVKSYLPGAGDESIELCQPLDSQLQHVDFECLFKCLSVCHLIQVCAYLLLVKVIFVANSLSTQSKCGHAVVAMLYPFTGSHTYFPDLLASMINIVGCSPTPFLIGILSCSLSQLQDLHIEEVLIVDLCVDKFLQEVPDEDEIPPKLQAALMQILEERNELLVQEQNFSDVTLNSLVSKAFVRFFVELVGHYSLSMTVTERGELIFQREPFCKSHTSQSVRHFLDFFMETQMFAGFIQDPELQKTGVKDLFEVRAFQYLKTIPESESSGMNRILQRLGSKMKFLQKK
ncbi:LOW QUALITY PROTEIN: DENN domain-containing protein 2C [Hipposideros larvatus]